MQQKMLSRLNRSIGPNTLQPATTKTYPKNEPILDLTLRSLSHRFILLMIFLRPFVIHF